MKNLIVTLSLLATLLTMGCASTSETVPTTTPDRMLKNWATRLREAMDAVMRPSASEA